ncbi:hypothetical protein BDY24DRAFT_402877 [Mrakia frigida]|uniref:uncharacterized protein n=1 Tax=Mrakia frigida TaxID=29902 RepID=UPI003FCBF7A1
MSSSTAQTDELAFVQAQVSKLASLPVQYDDDFVSPEANKPRKAQLVDIPVTPLPEKKKEILEGEGSSSGGGASSDTISLTIKSLKPPLTFSLPAVSLSDTIASLKDLLLSTYPSTAPPPSHQRLLLKGKALADTKLLKEYISSSGEAVTLNLMVKAGWIQPSSSDAAAPSTSSLPAINTSIPAPTTPETQTAGGSPSRPLTPIPTLTLTPSPDLNSFHTHPTSTSPSHSPHATLANPKFWVELLAFLKGKYAKEEEAEAAWETFLRSQKGGMSPGEVAMARDETGVFGMGGQ